MEDKMEAEALNKITEELEHLKEKVDDIERELNTLKEPEVKKKYLDKLKRIEQEKGRVFDTKEEMLKHLQNEV